MCSGFVSRLTAATAGGWYDKVQKLANSLDKKTKPMCDSNSEFLCHSGSLCVTSDDVCDGFADCDDGSDERDCGECHQLEMRSTSELYFLPNAASGGNVSFQLVTSHEGKNMVYSSTSLNDPPLFVRQVAPSERWEITDGWGFSKVLAVSLDDGWLPSIWNVSGENAWNIVNINLYCIKPVLYTPRFENLISNKTTNMTLKDMYVSGHHLKDDVIEACNWKGKPCSADDFQTIFTDLGVCYKFTPPTKVDKSGPGFGLGLTLNIEQYEYTKNVQSGVGVQLLLHDANDLALMKEKSIALSPGLYSLLSIERTEVENIEPPWGNCSQKELKYYHYYTLATCFMDCENAIVREQCGCIDIYMPDPDNYPVCSVDTYVNCAKPTIERFRRSGTCECMTPCKENIYVPTLSFSSITINTDSLTGSEKRKLDNWRIKLSKAREIMYRIYPEKYRQTQKVFYTMTSAVAVAYNTLHDAMRKMNAEIDDVSRILWLVNYDCIAYMNLTSTVIGQMRRYIREPLDEFRQYFVTNILNVIFALRAKIQALTRTYVDQQMALLSRSRTVNSSATDSSDRPPNDTRTATFADCVYRYLESFGCGNVPLNLSFADFWNVTDGLNLTGPILKECVPDSGQRVEEPNIAEAMASELRPLVEALSYAIEHARQTLLTKTVNSIKQADSSDSRNYVLRHDVAGPLLVHLPTSCDWCLSRDDQTSLVEILSSDVSRTLGTNASRLAEDLVFPPQNSTCHLTWTSEDQSAGGPPVTERLDYMQLILRSLDTDGYLLSGRFLEDLPPPTMANDTSNGTMWTGTAKPVSVLGNCSVPEVTDVLLTLASETASGVLPVVLRKIDAALELVASFRDYMRPKCRGDVRNLKDNYEDSNTAITWVLDSMMRYLYKYARTLAALRTDYDEAASITLERLADRLELNELIYFINTKTELVESMLNDKILYTRRTRDHLNRLYYWIVAQTTDAAVRKTHLWRYFRISQVDLSGPRTDPEQSLPLASDFQMKTTELNAYWRRWEMNETKSALVQNNRALAAQAGVNQVYLDDFVRGNKIENTFYRQNFLEVDMFYKVLAERTVEQQKAYEYPALLSEVGGLLGLLLGASVLTLCEFLDLLVVNTIRQIRFRRATKRIQNASDA